MTRVLFLDIDGVLNTHSAWRKGFNGHRDCDPDAMRRLNALCVRTGCRVVVSSTWRIGFYRGKDGCRAHLRRLGFRGRFHRDWRTGHDPSRVRGTEIAAWLAAHPGVAGYAIVDDDSDMLPEQMPRFVQTGYELGLEDTHVERLAALLHGCPAEATDPMDPPPPWLARGESWLQQHANMCQHPSRYMP